MDARSVISAWFPQRETEHLTANACISARNPEYQVEATRSLDFDFDSTSGRAAPRILCGTWDFRRLCIWLSSGRGSILFFFFFFTTRRELLVRNFGTAVLLDICHNGVIFHKWVPSIRRSYRVTSNRVFEYLISLIGCHGTRWSVMVKFRDRPLFFNRRFVSAISPC